MAYIGFQFLLKYNIKNKLNYLKDKIIYLYNILVETCAIEQIKVVKFYFVVFNQKSTTPKELLTKKRKDKRNLYA